MRRQAKSLPCAAVIALYASAAAPQGLPSFADVRGDISVTPPPIERVVHAETKAVSYRVLGSFFVTNGSTYDVADVAISCAFVTQSGTTLGTAEQTIYEIFQGGRFKSTLSEISLGGVPEQTSSVVCEPKGGKVLAYREPTKRAVPDGPNYAEHWPTCDCDMAEPLRNDPRNPAYLIPVRRRR